MPLSFSKKSIFFARLFELLVAGIAWLFLFGRRKDEHPPKDFVIVLVEPFQMGDVLSLSVMLDPTLERFPECRIVVWCHDRNKHVYQDDHRVWKIVSARFFWSNRTSKRSSFSDWRSILQSILAVRSLRPQFGIDTRGEIRNQALLCFAGCIRRIGFLNYFSTNMNLRGLLLNDSLGVSPLEHRVHTNLRLLAPLLEATPKLKLPSIAVQHRNPDPAQRRIVAIHIGAGWVYRQWSSERWIELIDALSAFPNLRVILIEGPGEAEVNARIASSLSLPIERRATTYSEMLTILSQASLFIGLDSGPMHAATLLGIPAIALFGPGDASVWYPISKGSVTVHHIEDYPCNPCLQKVCVRVDDPCMKRIQVAEVLEAVSGTLYPAFSATKHLVSIALPADAIHSGKTNS